MKVVLVLLFVLLAAATALALGSGTVASVMNSTAAAVQMADQTREPATLLLSGSVLLGLAGLVKRFTV